MFRFFLELIHPAMQRIFRLHIHKEVQAHPEVPGKPLADVIRHPVPVIQDLAESHGRDSEVLCQLTSRESKRF